MCAATDLSRIVVISMTAFGLAYVLINLNFLGGYFEPKWVRTGLMAM